MNMGKNTDKDGSQMSVSDHRVAPSGYLRGYEGFSEVTGGRALKRPAREPWN